MSEALHRRFRAAVTEPGPDPGPLTADELRQLPKLFTAQLISRHADLAARDLRAKGKGYYTISSAGHEGNAAVAAALRTTDPALLHYRSGAFYVQRSRMAGRIDALQDILLGVMGAADEPISQGRHKVFGRTELSVIPQTSTIASQVPRALGVAFAIGRGRRLGIDLAWPTDAVTVCSFGDASLNHSTAAGAINAAVQISHRGLPMPLLLVCEDNGLGISMRTPGGWVESVLGSRPGLRYAAADGSDLLGTLRTASTLTDWVRRTRRPAVLHLSTVRLLGHAGSDVEAAYRSPAEIEADLDRDPVVASARSVIAAGLLSVDAVLELYERTRADAATTAVLAAARPQLASAAAVMEPLTRTAPQQVAAISAVAASPAARAAWFTGKLPEDEGGLTLAQTINRTLADLLAAHPGALVFGEDVADKGGVYGVTRGLARAAGRSRVFDTLLDEQTILGLGLGAGISGLLPLPEIQYLAYLHHALDQIRGEGASQAFFSAGQYTNPMVVRVAGLAYQKGFGGHFHNDNSLTALRDIPGLVVAVPAHPDDAAGVLRSCVAVAQAEGRIAVVVEPIALYHTKDLHTDGDNGWLAACSAPEQWPERHVPVGRARTHGDGGDLTIVTFGNGLRMSLRVARRLAGRGIGCRVVDLRWIAPLPLDDVLEQARLTGRLLVVDETRRTGGVAEAVVTGCVLAGFTGPIEVVAGEDSFIPLGAAADLVLVDENAIGAAALRLLHR